MISHSINPTSHTSHTPGCALPGTPLANAVAGLDACVHCGFCLQACPTYVNLEDENDSPRGRIVLMRRMLEGEIALDDPAAARHLDQCLGCRACETACPSGVPYGELLEATRATMAPVRGTSLIASTVLTIFRHEWLLRPVLLLARLFRDTRLPALLAPRLPRTLGFPLAMLASTRSPLEHVAPAHVADAQVTAARTVRHAAPDTTATSVAVLTGCVTAGLLPQLNSATAKALAHNGFSLLHTPGQVCCGALHAHAGDLGNARALARKNIAAFEHANADLIAVNAAGCGAMLKQYAHLLQDDPAWGARAAAISEKTRDVSELLAAAGPLPGVQPVRFTVTHDPPCHQMHAQRIVAAPLALLDAVPGVQRIPLEDADQCCGSAGIYNLLEPATSDAVLAPKLARIAESGAELVASGNPGCMMQLGAGLLLAHSAVRVVHPVELLAASYPCGRRR